MKFIFQMAWRDSRASRRRLLLFSLSIVFGIAALVALGSGSASLTQAIHGQAKGLLGADLVLTTRTPPSAALGRYLDSLGGAQASDESFSSVMVFPTAGGATHLVQVRAMEGDFPFYGDFLTAPADAPARLRRGEGVVILEETLLNEFGVKAGDAVKLGRTTFTVAGALQKLPGESAAVATLAPRALIPRATLAATGLAGPESLLVRYRVALRLPPGADPDRVAGDVQAKFPGERISLETPQGRERELGRALTNVYGFLSLVGLVALLLGAIGIASAIHSHVRQKIPTIAVLRCLGASAGQSFAIYLAQGVGLGVVGAILGAALGVALQQALPAVLKDWLPFPVEFFIAWPAVARGMFAGLVVCVLFTLFPLLAVRRVSPLSALRAGSEATDSPPDRWRLALAAVIALALTRFAIAQLHSRRHGVGFVVMLALGLGALAGLARLVAWAARRWAPRRLPYAVRQGIANLHRPNNRTVLLLVSLGLGTFLILTLYLARSTLLGEVEGMNGRARPNLLFFDIQDDQVGPLVRLAEAQGVPVLQQAPVVTMRIAAIRGRGVEDLLKDGAGRLPGWALRREYRSTFRGALAGSERIVAGEFAGRAGAGGGLTPISVEEGLFRDLQLKLGDEIDWDLQGVPLRTRVASVRAVDWRRLEPNFFVVFPAGVLESAPKSYLVALRAATPADSARVQRALAGAFPNASAIDLALLLQTLDTIFGKVAFVVDFMALFTVATGLAVLAGAVVAGRYQRIRETVLLRTLGATRRQLAQIQLVEYTVLGFLAALVGSGLALAGSALLAHFVFDAPLVAPPLDLAVAGVAVVAVTLLTGRLADRGVADRPPLEVLRAEGT
jgi:putative ABC transport system permease protein